MKFQLALAILLAVTLLPRASAEAPAVPPESVVTTPAPLFRDPVFDGAAYNVRRLLRASVHDVPSLSGGNATNKTRLERSRQ